MKIHALTINTQAAIVVGGDTSNGNFNTGANATESDLYPGMTNGVNALAVVAGPGFSDEWDNVRYNGSHDRIPGVSTRRSLQSRELGRNECFPGELRAMDQ